MVLLSMSTRRIDDKKIALFREVSRSLRIADACACVYVASNKVILFQQDGV